MALVKADIGGNITVRTPLSDNENSKFPVTSARYMICSPPKLFYYFFFLHLICSYLYLLIFLIQRLENKYASNPSKYQYLYSMVQEEMEAKMAKGSSSCTNGILWLTRCLMCPIRHNSSSTSAVLNLVLIRFSNSQGYGLLG